MPDTFDRYREALVVEMDTIWPEEFRSLSEADKERIDAALHTDPKTCSQIEYVRVHTGFARRITVTAEDVRRVKESA